MDKITYGRQTISQDDIDEVVKRTEINTKISTKLDGIASDVKETSKNVDRLREDIAEHGSRITAVEQSVKSAHHRIDTVEKHIGYGATEHRERSRDEE